MTISHKYEIKKEDLIKVGINALIFLGPALLVLIPSIAKQIPAEAGYGALALYVLNLLADVLRKFLSENKYR